MRFGLIVDGDAEFASFRHLYPQLADASGDVFLGPLKANIQPYAPVPVMARSCESGIQQLLMRNVEVILVLLDREQRRECAPTIASDLERALVRYGGVSRVIIKNRTFENWLVSDLGALAARRARFSVSNRVRNQIEPDKADNVDAVSLLGRCCVNTPYSKVRDAQGILERADVLRMAAHSRSFRRFLHLANHPSFAPQSRRPL
jgi:hypothetical protein